MAASLHLGSQIIGFFGKFHRQPGVKINYFDQIPNEILLIILQKSVQQGTDLKTLAVVDKRFYYLTKDYSVKEAALVHFFSNTFNKVKLQSICSGSEILYRENEKMLQERHENISKKRMVHLISLYFAYRQILYDFNYDGLESWQIKIVQIAFSNGGYNKLLEATGIIDQLMQERYPNTIISRICYLNNNYAFSLISLCRNKSDALKIFNNRKIDLADKVDKLLCLARKTYPSYPDLLF